LKRKKSKLIIGLYYYLSFSGFNTYYPISIDHKKKYAQLLHATINKAGHWKVKRSNYEHIIPRKNYIELVIYES